MSGTGQRRWTSRRARRLLAVVVAAVLVVGTVVYLGHRQVVDEVSRYVTPSPERSFVWVGKASGQFTDSEVGDIAARYSYVVIARTHAGANIQRQLDDIRRIKTANPAVKVFLYVNTSYWYDTNDTPEGWGTHYDHAWSLRDRSGNILRFAGAGANEQGVADFVDLGNQAYRTYLLSLIASWSTQAPFDGVAFDSAHPLYPDLPVARRPGVVWSSLVDTARLNAFNTGLVDLFTSAKSILGPGRSVLYNGIADQPILVDRNLALLDDTDMTVDEEFCLNLDGTLNPQKLNADLQIMAQVAAEGKKLLEKTNTDKASDVEQAGRFCSGAFLLGWQPGSTYFKLGPGYTAEELSSDPPTADLALGNPVGSYRTEQGLAYRDFDNGRVVVNMSDQEQTAPAGRAGTLIADGEADGIAADDDIVVEPRDAVFILNRPAA